MHDFLDLIYKIYYSHPAITILITTTLIIIIAFKINRWYMRYKIECLILEELKYRRDERTITIEDIEVELHKDTTNV